MAFLRWYPVVAVKASSSLLFFLTVVARDTEGSLAEVIRAWFAVSIRFPRSPPLEIPCARHLCRHDSYFPGCLTKNLPLSMHSLCCRSFWPREIGEVVAWLKMPHDSQRG